MCVIMCVILSSLFLTGCSTYYDPWKARIGSVTYDEVVNELGEPQRLKVFDDRLVTAAWIHDRQTQIWTTRDKYQGAGKTGQ